MPKILTFVTLSVLAVTIAAAQTSLLPLPTVYASGTVTVTGGNGARWNVLNAPLPAPLVGPTCFVNLNFRTTDGQVLKQGQLTLKPGESGALQLSDGEIPPTPSVPPVQRASSYAVAAATNSFGGPCKLITTLEVFDAINAKTSLVLSGLEIDQSVARPVPTVQEPINR